MLCPTGGDLLYFLHVVPERQFEVIGGDAAETIVEEDVSAEQQVVRVLLVFIVAHTAWSFGSCDTPELEFGPTQTAKPVKACVASTWPPVPSACLQAASSLCCWCYSIVADPYYHILQVEDAKNFITNRILQLAEQRQAPNKVSAGTNGSAPCLCNTTPGEQSDLRLGCVVHGVAGTSASSMTFAG